MLCRIECQNRRSHALSKDGIPIVVKLSLRGDAKRPSPPSCWVVRLSRSNRADNGRPGMWG